MFKCTCKMLFTSQDALDAHLSFYQRKHDDRGATYPYKHRVWKNPAKVAVEREAAKRLKRNNFLNGS